MSRPECHNRSFPEVPQTRIEGDRIVIPLIQEDPGFCFLLQDDCKYPDKGSSDCPVATGKEKVTRYGAHGSWNIL